MTEHHENIMNLFRACLRDNRGLSPSKPLRYANEEKRRWYFEDDDKGDSIYKEEVCDYTLIESIHAKDGAFFVILNDTKESAHIYQRVKGQWELALYVEYMMKYVKGSRISQTENGTAVSW